MTNLVKNHSRTLRSHGQRVDYYPVSLALTGVPCLVVGGGRVAARKVAGLVGAGAFVTVVAREVVPEVEHLSTSAPVTIEARAYVPGEAARYRLVITATGDPAVDGEVARDADAAGVWVNSADDPANCSFILPAVHRDGDVTIAVSTGGTSPALASWLRSRFAAVAGEGIATLAQLLGEARSKVKASGRSTESIDWHAALDGPLVDLVAEGRHEEARRIIESTIR